MVNQHQELAVEMHLVWTVKSRLFLARCTPTNMQKMYALMCMVRGPVLHTTTVQATVLFHHQYNNTPAIVKDLTLKLKGHTTPKKAVCSR